MKSRTSNRRHIAAGIDASFPYITSATPAVNPLFLYEANNALTIDVSNIVSFFRLANRMMLPEKKVFRKAIIMTGYK